MFGEEDVLNETAFWQGIDQRAHVACCRCRAQKIKCSGDSPCLNCHRAGVTSQCDYPSLNRKVTVPLQYLRRLRAELASLRKPSASSGSTTAPLSAANNLSNTQSDNYATPEPNSTEQTTTRSAIHHNPSSASDVTCTTFTIQLIRFLGSQSSLEEALSRPSFADIQLLRSFPVDVELPSRMYGKLLVRSYLRFMGADFHFLPRKRYFLTLDQIYEQDPSARDCIELCKLFAVFALGELYSAGTRKAQSVPGMSFFLKAIGFLQDRYEDSSITYVEALLILSVYAQALNRNKTAYMYVGLALRASLALGLHRADASDDRLTPFERETRIRVWWTAYCLDRLYTSKLGYPMMMIQGFDANIAPPSMHGLTEDEQEEFFDPQYLLSHISLSRITGTITATVYHRTDFKSDSVTIEEEISHILQELSKWHSELPTEIRIDRRRSPIYPSRTAASLNLHFGQCIVLVTRPTFFHVFQEKYRQTAAADTGIPRASKLEIELADDCVRAAQLSNEILTQLWVDGNLATFGYFDALSLFSTTTILMMASVMEVTDNNTYMESIETAWNLLKSMADEGNIPAKSYLEILLELEKSFAQRRGRQYDFDTLGRAESSSALDTVLSEGYDALQNGFLLNQNDGNRGLETYPVMSGFTPGNTGFGWKSGTQGLDGFPN